jgi:hypothetical protein
VIVAGDSIPIMQYSDLAKAVNHESKIELWVSIIGSADELKKNRKKLCSFGLDKSVRCFLFGNNL